MATSNRQIPPDPHSGVNYDRDFIEGVQNPLGNEHSLITMNLPMNIIKGSADGLSHYCIMMSRLSSLYRERFKSHRIRREGGCKRET